MGLPAQSSLMPFRARPGLAMPSALFGLVAVSLLAGGIWVMTTRNNRLAEGREDVARAMMIAEAGASHAVALLRTQPLRDTSFTRLLRGSDGAPGTADDGLLSGYTLTANDSIPSTGYAFTGGTYWAQILDDNAADEDTDPLTDANRRLVIRCRGMTANGAEATINAIIAPSFFPAMTANGNVTVQGSPSSGSITGDCGSIHANGDLNATAGSTVEGTYSAVGTASGTVVHPDGTAVTPQSGADSIALPNFTYNDFCTSGWTYQLMSNGSMQDASGTIIPTLPGWSYNSSNRTWRNQAPLATGTYCVEGNVELSGNVGPVNVSIIASNSISLGGGTSIGTATHPDGISLFAGGDIEVSGTYSSSTGTGLIQGAIYARNQCGISGTPRIEGSIMCLNDPTVNPSRNYVSSNVVGGNVQIYYDCTGLMSRFRRFVAWYQTLS